MKIWINACEVSGDLQAGALLTKIKEKKPDTIAMGMGGEKLAQAGQQNFFDIKELSVMGVSEILAYLPNIIKLWLAIKKKLTEEKPDLIILVDGGEFNFPIARMAKKLNIPVYYFIPPKVWAWRQYRIRFLKKYIDKILCILPFEVEFYRKHDMNVTYIQNPLVELLAPYTQEKRSPIPFRIALMPGSRKKEISVLLPIFARVAEIVKEKIPQLEFYIIQAPNFTEEYLKSFWTANTIPIKFVKPENRYEFLRSCHICLAASGTATLETGLLHVPTIVSYKVSTFSYCVARLFVGMRTIGLTNLVLDKDTFPEYVQNAVTPSNISSILYQWLTHEEILQNIEEDLTKLTQILEAEPAIPH